MVLRLFTVLNRKLRAAVQTSQAHHALVLDPDGAAVPQLNRPDRTFRFAQSAAYAIVFHMEMRRAPHLFVINRLGNPFGEKRRRAGRHMPVCPALIYAANQAANLFFGCLFILFNLFGR